jgi:hypothetical protein
MYLRNLVHVAVQDTINNWMVLLTFENEFTSKNELILLGINLDSTNDGEWQYMASLLLTTTEQHGDRTFK